MKPVNVGMQEAPYLMRRNKLGEDGMPLVGNDRFDGYCAELARKIASIVNFDYILREVQDAKFGAFVNGSWNGMVGELYRAVRANWLIE
jgi:hypothetical protein